MSGRGTVIGTGLSKAFRIPQREHLTLRGRLLHPLSRPSYIEFQALRDVSFSVDSGEFFGIIGRNGSGKSTLLKLIAGIYRPDSGRAVVGGSIASFIELGVGFNMDLSGRDNLYINGALLGLSRREIRHRYDAIVDFAELQDFMDLKLRNYSSGMQVRLAFSVALQADADVLLTDEVLAVGDARFQEKCYEVFQERKRRGRTIIFVSHDMGAVQQFCDRVLLLDRGQEVDNGPAPLMARTYLQLNALGDRVVAQDAEGGEGDPGEKRSGDGAVRITGAWCEAVGRGRTRELSHGDQCRVFVQVEAVTEQRAPVVSFAMRDSVGQVVLGSSTLDDPTVEVAPLGAGDSAVVGFEFTNHLSDGSFSIDAMVAPRIGPGLAGPTLDNRRAIWKMESTGAGASLGVVAPPISIGVRTLSASDTPSDEGNQPDAEGPMLLVSAVGARAGLFELEPMSGEPHLIDRHATAGIAVAGDCLVRIVRGERASGLIEYRDGGLRAFHRLDDVEEASDIAVDGRDILVASTGGDRVMRVSPDGETTTEWHNEGAHGDVWHLTSVTRHDGATYATAFGRYQTHHEWLAHVGEPDGIAFSCADGSTLLQGLVHPQSLRRFEDGWLVCEAGTGTLVQLDDSGTVLRRVRLGGWLRGLAVSERHVFVGSSGERVPPEPPATGAELLVLDRDTLDVVRRVAIPTTELFSIALVDDPALLDAVRAPAPLAELGDALAAMRVAPTAAGRCLAEHEMRSALHADFESVHWQGSRTSYLTVGVENLAPSPIGSVLPHPVQLAYRWADTEGTVVGEGRQPLPGVIAPGETAPVTLGINRPARGGRLTLTLSLVQEGVAWFVDADPSNGRSTTIRLDERAAAGAVT